MPKLNKDKQEIKLLKHQLKAKNKIISEQAHCIAVIEVHYEMDARQFVKQISNLKGVTVARI